MSRPTPSPDSTAYLVAEADWIEHREVCEPCRSSRTGRPRCPSGWVHWTAMIAALDALNATADRSDLTISVF